jgi:hypothetical protein
MKVQKFCFSPYKVYFSSFEVMCVDSNIKRNNKKENVYSILSTLILPHSLRWCVQDQ